MRELCDKHGILLIADEIICGFGRLGTWFGMERFGVVPDIMSIAKALTSGELPVGGVVAKKEIAETFDKAEGMDGQFHHGVTYGGHPAVMAAGLKNLEIMEREKVVENSARMGEYLYGRAVSVLQENHPTVGYVGGGLGLLMAIEIVKNRKTKEKYPGGPQGEFTKRFTNIVRGHGLAIRVGDAIICSPPLTITKEIVDDIIDILSISLLGIIPDDEEIVISTNRGTPIAFLDDSKTAGAFRRIARRIEGENVPISPMGEIDAGLMARMRRFLGINRKEPERV